MHMLRRSYLKSVLGTMVAASTARHGLFEWAHAAQAPGAHRESMVPTTVAEALGSGASDSGVTFILEYPRAAIAAPPADKAALLRLVARDQAMCDNKARPDRERAALTLLQPVASDAATLATIARGFRGAMRIQAILPGIESRELKAILVRAAALVP
jgi:hypothetical protein